jgi:hypothetical protein
MAGLLALMAFVALRHGGCRVAPSGPPPGAPRFASGAAGVMVTCGGLPELVSLIRMTVLAAAAMVALLFALVFVQTIVGRRWLPLPVRPPLRPRLFALGAAIEAAAAGLVVLELLAPPVVAAGLPGMSNPLFIVGILVMWYARGFLPCGRGRGGLTP